MNINDLTTKQAKELCDRFGGQENVPSPHIGKKCIIRTNASGVHFGTLISQTGNQKVELKNARRLWRWDVAPHGISLSEVSRYGPVGERSIICCVVEEMSILDALEIIPCTDEAAKVIEAAKVGTP